ncbi:MAG: zinc-binding dehydrogenase [Myxococcales bacterium]|nr:zinc-binding dehydrogenase [Myxococcales bacterium]
MTETLPATMRALELRDHDGLPGSLTLVERPLPKPSQTEVLVKIIAANINPSDLMFLRGVYGTRRPLPTVPGFEGVGVVVSAGGPLGRLLVGRRVATSTQQSDGTWAEYMLASALGCVPLRDRISDDQGASFLINPFSAFGLFDTARRDGHKAAIHTAAASALGRMLVHISRRERFPMVHVVRRAAQVELLRGLGAEHVLDSSEADFQSKLHALAAQLNATAAFDAVAGPMSGILLHAMPRNSEVYVYGALSEAHAQFDPRDLIFEGKKVRGWWLAEYLRRPDRAVLAMASVPGYFDEGMASPVRARYPFSKVHEALAAYQGDMTAGKVLLVPDPR